MRPQPQQPRALSAGDTTNIQRGNLFRSLSIAPRPPHGLPPRFVLRGEFDTPLRGTMSRPSECDVSDHAYSCRGLGQCTRIPKRGGRQGCRTCIGVQNQSHKLLRRSSREEVEAYIHFRAPSARNVSAQVLGRKRGRGFAAAVAAVLANGVPPYCRRLAPQSPSRPLRIEGIPSWSEYHVAPMIPYPSLPRGGVLQYSVRKLSPYSESCCNPTESSPLHSVVTAAVLGWGHDKRES